MKLRERSEENHLSAMDIAILFLLLLFLFGGGIWVLTERMGRGTHREFPVRYTVRVKNVERSLFENETAESISTGDPVFSENGTARLGEVEGVEMREQRVAVYRNGTVTFVPHPDLVDVDVTVYGYVTEDEGDGWRIMDIRVAVGMKGAYRFGDFYASECTVIRAEPVEGENADEGA